MFAANSFYFKELNRHFKGFEDCLTFQKKKRKKKKINEEKTLSGRGHYYE